MGDLSFLWKTTGIVADGRCSVSGGDLPPGTIKELSDELILTNIQTTVTYSLSCVNVDAPMIVAKGEMKIIVGAVSVGLPAVTITLTGSPASEPVAAGKTALLSWSATKVDASNHTPCTGSWSIGTPLEASSESPIIIPNITAGSIYTIICTNQATGSGGTVIGVAHTGSASTPAVSDGTGMTPTLGVGKPTEGLVPCGTQRIEAVPGADYRAAAEDCNFAFLITLIKKILNFLIFVIAMPLAAISFAWAGWLYMSSAGNESNIKKAHEIFGNVVLGLCIALAAWLIVNAIVVGLGVLPKYNSLTGGTFGGS